MSHWYDEEDPDRFAAAARWTVDSVPDWVPCPPDGWDSNVNTTPSSIGQSA